ncbi:superoxide dismutase family protein [Croceicoccus marinus]|jgi:Cu-Zn family superoxide dismutase|nr:superoxide dismutase family protein [Croceicoccus marinus]
MNTRSIATTMLAGIGALAMTACAEEPTPAEPVADNDMEMSTGEMGTETASAVLRDTEGNEVGTVTATGNGEMLMVSVDAMGMPEGMHGAHIHTTGDCSASDFTSAGGHWNPTDVNHGTQSEEPNPHAGDLPNIEIAADGTGTLEGTSTGTFAGLMDADGSAFVIHAQPDDYESQPSGDAGDRIACGVFSAS